MLNLSHHKLLLSTISKSRMIRIKLLQRSIATIGSLSRRPMSTRLQEVSANDIIMLRNFSAQSILEKELHVYAAKKQTPVSLKSLMETGKGDKLQHFDAFIKNKFSNGNNAGTPAASDRIVIQVACFLYRELPIRLAQRAIKLEAAPIFQRSEAIKQVVSWYKTSFAQLRASPVPMDQEKEQIFAKVVENIYERHSATLITMAKGAHEIRQMLNQDVATFADYDDVQKRLDEFYMSRIGIRMLIGQYLALRTPSVESDMIGLISLRASPFQIAQQVIRDAAYMCTRAHGDAPEVTIHGRTDLTFPYVSSHISYMLLELVKNSMRATVETHGVDSMPPIKIIIADGEDNEDVVMKVSDEGGGIRRSNMNRIWSYLYTTADPKVIEEMLSVHSEDLKDFGTASPLAGLGYGLPIARNYARCFEGDLSLMSMEGYGTDSFIYLPRLGSSHAKAVAV